MTEEFYKFPSTPHLAALVKEGIRGDKVYSDKEREAFLQNDLIVEEKVDGANLGISFDASGNLILQNRGSQLRAPYTGQWKKIAEWIAPREDALFEQLGDQFILFGEWCYAQHSIHYDKLPDWFLGFDVFDKFIHRFFSTARRNYIFTAAGIHTVPIITKGRFSVTDLEGLFTRSHLGDFTAEGVYLRWEDEDWLVERAKLVRGTFTQEIEEHWSKRAIIPNKLAPSF